MSTEELNQTAVIDRFEDTTEGDNTNGVINMNGQQTNAIPSTVIETASVSVGRGRGLVRTPTPTLPGRMPSDEPPEFSPRFGQLEEQLRSMRAEMAEILSILNSNIRRSTGNRRTERGGYSSGSSNDDGDSPYPDESFEIVRRHRRREQCRREAMTQGQAIGQPNTFVPFQRDRESNGLNLRPNRPLAELGSVEREIRHVHFETAPPRTNSHSIPVVNNALPSFVDNNAWASQNIPENLNYPVRNPTPGYCKISVTRVLQNGQTVNEDRFVTEQQYRQIMDLTNDPVNFEARERRSVSRDSLYDRSSNPSRASIRSHSSGNLPSSTRYSLNRETPTFPRRDSLSWRTSDSSNDDLPYESQRRVRNSLANTNFHEISPIKIGQVVNSWKISFPKTEKDPEQFLLILMDFLSSSGIQKDLFVPCLSKIFEGPYRSWYLVNKRSWYTWKDFVRAFRYEWGVKKEDTDLLYEVRDLKIDKTETLAEFASRARLIFECMERPPPFQEQLSQILRKFSPRLMFEVLTLVHQNYTEFLHHANKRAYKHCDTQKPRLRSQKISELNQVQGQSNVDNSNDTDIDEENIKDSEAITDLKAVQNKSSGNTDKISKSLTKQRLEKILQGFDNSHKQNQTSSFNEKSSNTSNNKSDKLTFDPSKTFCTNCGQIGHSGRYCTNDRQSVCFKCRKSGHETRACILDQGNAKCPQ